jgi:hypothetical protein
MSRTPFILAAGLLAAGATAQEPAAAVATRVEGLVTVSQGQLVALLQPGTALREGARVVTGSSGKTLLRVGANCQVELNPNETIVLDTGKACPELIASVKGLGTMGAPGTQVASSGFMSTLMSPIVLGPALAGSVAALAAASGRSGPISSQ